MPLAISADVSDDAAGDGVVFGAAAFPGASGAGAGAGFDVSEGAGVAAVAGGGTAIPVAETGEAEVGAEEVGADVGVGGCVAGGGGDATGVTDDASGAEGRVEPAGTVVGDDGLSAGVGCSGTEAVAAGGTPSSGNALGCVAIGADAAGIVATDAGAERVS